jgi:hypothetical protein
MVLDGAGGWENGKTVSMTAKTRAEGKQGEQERGGVEKHSSPSAALAPGPERNPTPKEKTSTEETVRNRPGKQILTNISAHDIDQEQITPW